MRISVYTHVDPCLLYLCFSLPATPLKRDPGYILRITSGKMYIYVHLSGELCVYTYLYIPIYILHTYTLNPQRIPKLLESHGTFPKWRTPIHTQKYYNPHDQNPLSKMGEPNIGPKNTIILQTGNPNFRKLGKSNIILL